MMISSNLGPPPCPLAGTAGLAHPLGGGLGVSVHVGDVNIATKADHVAETKDGQKGEQLLIAKTAIGEDSDAAAGRHEFGQLPEA